MMNFTGLDGLLNLKSVCSLYVSVSHSACVFICLCMCFFVSGYVSLSLHVCSPVSACVFICLCMCDINGIYWIDLQLATKMPRWSQTRQRTCKNINSGRKYWRRSWKKNWRNFGRSVSKKRWVEEPVGEATEEYTKFKTFVQLKFLEIFSLKTTCRGRVASIVAWGRKKFLLRKKHCIKIPRGISNAQWWQIILVNGSVTKGWLSNLLGSRRPTRD